MKLSKRLNRRLPLAATSLLVFALLTPTAFMQQSGGPYLLNPSVIAGGGGTSTGGTHNLTGTVGQGVPGASSGGSFSLDAGFWNPALGCLSLSSTSQSFTANGGTGSVNVTGAANCAWTAISNNPDFITVTAGANGSGNGTVSYSVAPHNNAALRSGTLTIANQTFTIFQGAAFLDVPIGHPFYEVIGKLSARGVTAGCGGGNYCPDAVVTREQMSAFILRAKGEFNPSAPTSQRFQDVPPANPFYAFIDRMAVLGITAGCGGNNYCPTNPVLREQMSAFIIRALHEVGYVPPMPASQRFGDVMPGNPFYAFIEEMAVRNVTAGCSVNPPLYCPTGTVTRAQMAAFLVRAFNL